MDLELEDFTTSFLDTEVIQVPLKTKGGKSIYLRSLSRFDITRFRVLDKKIKTRHAADILIVNIDELYETPIREEDLDAAEDFLIIKSFCDKNGKLLFSSVKEYCEWSKNVSNGVIQEILVAIEEKMHIFYDPSADREDIKKK